MLWFGAYGGRVDLSTFILLKFDLCDATNHFPLLSTFAFIIIFSFYVEVKDVDCGVGEKHKKSARPERKFKSNLNLALIQLFPHRLSMSPCTKDLFLSFSSFQAYITQHV